MINQNEEDIIIHLALVLENNSDSFCFKYYLSLEKKRNKSFNKKTKYHLPQLDGPLIDYRTFMEN